MQLLSVLGEPLRWRIVELLTDQQLCVCHLVDELDAPQSLVSHHLKVLREAGLVESERFRYWTYYRARPRCARLTSPRICRRSRGSEPTVGPPALLLRWKRRSLVARWPKLSARCCSWPWSSGPASPRNG